MNEDSSAQALSTKGVTLSFSGYALYLVALGCFLDVLSTFFPWSETDGQHWFLPFSVSLPLGWHTQFMSESLPLLAISVATRVAAFVGLAGIVLWGRFQKGVFPSALLVFSTVLSFFSFGVFSQLGWSLYFGSYLALSGGLVKVVGIILENLEVQIVAKEEETSVGS